MTTAPQPPSSPHISPRPISSAEDFQACLFESLQQQLPLVAALPPYLSQLSLYAFTAMNWRGLVVAVCLDQAQLELNLDILRHSGFEEPEIALLHNGLMPHQQRALYEHLNQNRIKLLLTTADAFASVRFMATLARLSVALLVVEDAHNLLPGFGAAPCYKPLASALKRLSPLPPLCLLTGPMGPRWHWQILQDLGASGGVFCQYHTLTSQQALSAVSLQTHACLTRQYQYSQLSQWVGALPGHHQTSAHQPGATLIRTRQAPTAFRIGGTLDHIGIDPVWLDPFAQLAPPGLEPPDPRSVRRWRKDSPTGALVSVGYPTRFWAANPSTHNTVVWWDMPTHLGDVLWDALLAGQTHAEGSEKTTVHVCYSKESLAERRQELQKIPTRIALEPQPTEPTGLNSRQRAQQALEDVSQWCLSHECRLTSLARYMDWPLQFGHPNEPETFHQLTCGHCDVCLGHQGLLKGPATGWWQQPAQWLRHLLYS
ncbi:MAG: hypothetical protein U0003_02845 [Vampirovibrionales bacterium]